MTWILPKQLHTLVSALDTEALILDSAEQSQIFAQSLFLRSKVSPARTWSLKWKRDSWTQHLFGRILKPSLSHSFVDRWISSLGATHANHSAQQESDLGKKTPGTFGLSLQMELLQCDQISVSLKTSRDISRWGCPTSSRIWQEWVIEQRGAYSLRVKSEHLINANESSSWPTVRTSDCQNSPMSEHQGAYSMESHAKKNRMSLLPDAVQHWPTPTVAEAGKIGNQSNHGQLGLSNHPSIRGEVDREKYEKGSHGPLAPVSTSMDGNLPESWATPQVNWSTPEASQGGRQGGSFSQSSWKKEDGTPTQLSLAQATTIDQQAKKLPSGKLNPRWVETLMGLPVGWTMPSCVSPVTTAPTSCACLGTESSPPPQNEHSELFTLN
jgi:hypothetical protein